MDYLGLNSWNDLNINNYLIKKALSDTLGGSGTYSLNSKSIKLYYIKISYRIYNIFLSWEDVVDSYLLF